MRPYVRSRCAVREDTTWAPCRAEQACDHVCSSRRYPSAAMLVPTLPKVGATRRQLWTVGAIAAVAGIYAVGALIMPGTLFDPIMDAFIDNAPVLLVVLV